MNWFKEAQKSVILSAPEMSWAEWAIDPMFDHWCTEEGAWDREGDIYNESDLPRIMGNNLFISNIQEINEDLLYRLEEQARDVSRTDSNSAQQESARSRGALSLSKKIRGIL